MHGLQGSILNRKSRTSKLVSKLMTLFINFNFCITVSLPISNCEGQFTSPSACSYYNYQVSSKMIRLFSSLYSSFSSFEGRWTGSPAGIIYPAHACQLIVENGQPGHEHMVKIFKYIYSMDSSTLNFLLSRQYILTLTQANSFFSTLAHRVGPFCKENLTTTC